MRHYQLFIDGTFVDAADGRTVEATNPSNDQPVATVALADREDMHRAIGAAREAFDEGPWAGMAPEARGKVMMAALEKMAEREQDFAAIECADAGHTMRMASLFTVPYSNEFWRYLTEFGARMDYVEPAPPYGFPAPSWDFVIREPFGVCAAIIPWNLPYMMAIWKLAPALITGNTVVLKPALETPVSALALAEILAEFLPPGVVNILPGPGPTAGESLITDPRIDKIAFTGSTETGRRIMQLAAPHVTYATLELGGKSANIVLDDADLDIAVPGSLWAIYMHQGQACESGSRLFAPASLHDELVARLVEATEKLVVGPAGDFDTDLGPVLNRTQFDTIMRYISAGEHEGAKLLTGGHQVFPSGGEGGFYVAPTIFGGVDNDMRIAREEIFGPVLSVIRYESVEDAIRMANDSIYGLAGGVWSRDIPRALNVARRLRCGTVWVNDWHLLSPAAPHGGYRQSGVGREFGPWGLKGYLETKYVRVDQVPTREGKFWYQVIGL